jgi:hypothetical protein
MTPPTSNPSAPGWDHRPPSTDYYSSATPTGPFSSGEPSFRWNRPPPPSAAQSGRAYSDSIPRHQPGKYDTKRPFNGVIDYLTSQYRGNVVLLKVVNVIFSSIGPDASPAHLVDFDNKNTDFVSFNKVKQYVGYDFGDRQLRITHYSLRASLAGKGPKSWRIIVSRDGQNWDVADERTLDRTLDGSGGFAAFQVQVKNLVGRYVAIQQTGRNHGGTKQLRISAFEVFGRLGSGNLDIEPELDDEDP